MTQHANRKHLRARCHTRHTNAVVGDLTDVAEHMSAVPAAVFSRGAAIDNARAGAGGPVAGVPTTRHAAIRGATRSGCIGDEVIAAVGQRGVQIGMRCHTRIDLGNGHAGTVVGRPNRRCITATPVGIAGSIGADRLDRAVARAHMPLEREARIVRRTGAHRSDFHGRRSNVLHDAHPYIRLDVRHRRIGSDLSHQCCRFALAELAVGANKVRADGKLALPGHAYGLGWCGLECSRIKLGTRHGGGDILRHSLSIGALCRATTVDDDEAVVAWVGAKCRRVDLAQRIRRYRRTGSMRG